MILLICTDVDLAFIKSRNEICYNIYVEEATNGRKQDNIIN